MFALIRGIRLRLAGASLFLLACALLPAMAEAREGLDVYALPFKLTDDRGRESRLADWRGREAVVSMEYANCRFICSITLQRLKDVQAAADRAKRPLDFIVISLDPANDTPAAWQRYRKSRDLERDNWRFLTASAADTPRIARALGVKYWLYDGHIMHDFRLLKLSASGSVEKVMETYDADPDEFVR